MNARIQETVFRKLISKPNRSKDNIAARKISKKLFLKERRIDQFDLLTVKAKISSQQHIIMLHGGAYIAEARSGHRTLIEKLALNHGFTVSYVDYPLAPRYQAKTTLDIVIKAYSILLEAYPGDSFFLLGDSAGGGLALSLLQLLKDQDCDRMPDKTVLLSPWLDISMMNPEIINYEDKDVLLSVKGLKECGNLYAGNLDRNDPRVSPIFGDLNKLGELLVFVSTHEVFYPDCMMLEEKIKVLEGTRIQLIVKYKLIHDWIIFPIREREETIKEIAAFLNNSSS